MHRLRGGPTTSVEEERLFLLVAVQDGVHISAWEGNSMYMLTRDAKGKKKEASKIKQTTRHVSTTVEATHTTNSRYIPVREEYSSAQEMMWSFARHCLDSGQKTIVYPQAAKLTCRKNTNSYCIFISTHFCRHPALIDQFSRINLS